MMRWSERETIQFARIYLKHEGLWNTEHPQYRVKYTRERSYDDIVKEFQAKTGIILQNAEVKRKVKNLRSTYCQEVTKILRRSGPEAIYKPTIKWFDEWHRCFKNTNKCRFKDEDLGLLADQEDTSEKLLTDSDSNDDNNITQSDPFVSPETEPGDYIYIVKPEPGVSESLKQENQGRDNSYKIKRKKYRKSSNLVYPESTVRNSIEDTDTETKSKEDEFDIYGKFIASQLRKMELESALRMQLRIHSLMSEARISDITG